MFFFVSFLSSVVSHVFVCIHSSFRLFLYPRSDLHVSDLVEAVNVIFLLFLQYMEAIIQFKFEGFLGV